MALTEKELQEEAENITKVIYPQGDNFYTKKTKSGDWILGYSNDYPMQHGGGQSCVIPLKLLEHIAGLKDALNEVLEICRDNESSIETLGKVELLAEKTLTNR